MLGLCLTADLFYDDLYHKSLNRYTIIQNENQVSAQGKRLQAPRIAAGNKKSTKILCKSTLHQMTLIYFFEYAHSSVLLDVPKIPPTPIASVKPDTKIQKERFPKENRWHSFM